MYSTIISFSLIFLPLCLLLSLSFSRSLVFMYIHIFPFHFQLYKCNMYSTTLSFSLSLFYISPTLPPSSSLILKKFSFYVHTYFSIPFSIIPTLYIQFSIIPTLYIQYHSLILSLIFLPLLGLSLSVSFSRSVCFYVHTYFSIPFSIIPTL